MIRKAYYIVADILFRVELEEDSFLWPALDSYHPFEVEELQKPPVFSLSIGEWQNDEYLGTLIASTYNHVLSRQESVYKRGSEYVFDYCYDSPRHSYRIHIDRWNYATISIVPGCGHCRDKLTATLHQVFYVCASLHSTLMFHASCVIKDGKAVLFHAPSGTGKSTHSQQWMKAFPDAELLNDDGPIVRVWSDGRVIAYGSSWSGQTPCYKNLSAPVAAFVRINRANENKIHRLNPVQAYASLMPSCTGQVKWNKEITEAQHQTLNDIIVSVPCYQLDCLPNEDAAKVCAAEVLK